MEFNRGTSLELPFEDGVVSSDTTIAGISVFGSTTVIAYGCLEPAASLECQNVWLKLDLYVSLNVFGRHRNEAFSSLKIEDWKNFLRIHIDSEGALTIFSIGISRVPRRWTEVKDGDGKCLYEPNDPAATPPELIEEPIVVFK